MVKDAARYIERSHPAKPGSCTLTRHCLQNPSYARTLEAVGSSQLACRDTAQWIGALDQLIGSEEAPARADTLGRVDSWDSQIRLNVIQGFLLGGSL
ncbi:hypothetical protein AAFX91_36850, partial [Bradyrhizobium sp. 31Argb]|uniref:hypothetical protein n=1 Tax=Bradyrhizobium sp. 31Argb TaxID=3141247 RepID=UPI00374A04CB